MNTREIDSVTQIGFPNTVSDQDKTWYTTKAWYSFEEFFEAGEMANISWFAIYKDWKLHARIKRSVCDIYY